MLVSRIKPNAIISLRRLAEIGFAVDVAGNKYSKIRSINDPEECNTRHEYVIGAVLWTHRPHVRNGSQIFTNVPSTRLTVVGFGGNVLNGLCFPFEPATQSVGVRWPTASSKGTHKACARVNQTHQGRQARTVQRNKPQDEASPHVVRLPPRRPRCSGVRNLALNAAGCCSKPTTSTGSGPIPRT